MLAVAAVGKNTEAVGQSTQNARAEPRGGTTCGQRTEMQQ